MGEFAINHRGGPARSTRSLSLPNYMARSRHRGRTPAARGDTSGQWATDQNWSSRLKQIKSVKVRCFSSNPW